MQSKALAVGLACAFAAEGVRHKRTGLGTMAGLHVHKDHVDAEDFLLLFKRGADDAAIKAVCQGRCQLEGHPSRGGFAFAKVKGRNIATELLSVNSEQVQMVEVDTLDYLVPELEATSSESWGLDRIGAPSREVTGKGVTVFVQDTGVHVAHKDFGGRAISTYDMTRGDSGEECEIGDEGCAADKQGHGTHCAGTAAGTSYGVAPNAVVRAVKTLNDNGSGARSWQVDAMDWIATSEFRPAVLSMSLGGRGKDPSYDGAVDALNEAGVTVVVAAGNDNSNACGFSPAFALKAVTVGSIDNKDQRSGFSNYGECVQIWAPGSNIISARHDATSGSRSLSGTSMACPHVSGGAALQLERTPGATSDQVLEALLASSEVGAISDLKSKDVNNLLWVGEGDAPVPAPTPAPPPTPEVDCSDCGGWGCFFDRCQSKGCCA